MHKKILLWFASFLMIVALPLLAFAHSGRTDKNGGHKDNQNKSGLGYYHYHCGGHPPHLHENGTCPYAGIEPGDRYSTKSSKGTYGSTYTSKKIPQSSQLLSPSPTASSKENKSIPAWAVILYMVLLFSFIPLLILLYGLCRRVLKFIMHLSPKWRLAEFSRLITAVTECRSKQKELVSLILSTEYSLPRDCIIGADGLPMRTKATNGRGAPFTYYKTRTGRGRLHLSCSCASAYRPVHVYSDLANIPPSDSFCRRCGSPPPLFDWLRAAVRYRFLFKLECDSRDKLPDVFRAANTQLQKLLTAFSSKLRTEQQFLNEKYKMIKQQSGDSLTHLQILRAFNRFFLDFETGLPAKEVYVFTKKVALLYSDKPPGSPNRKEYTLEGLVEYVRHEGGPPPEFCYLLRINYPSGGYLHFEGCKNGIYLNKTAKIIDSHGDVYYVKLLPKSNSYGF